MNATERLHSALDNLRWAMGNPALEFDASIDTEHSALVKLAAKTLIRPADYPSEGLNMVPPDRAEHLRADDFAAPLMQSGARFAHGANHFVRFR